MWIIVDGEKIWNWRHGHWDTQSDTMRQAYVQKHDAKRVLQRVQSLQGTLAGELAVMTYQEWAEKTGGTW